MIRLPGAKGARRTGAIVQFHDLLPTVLDLLGMANNTLAMHGRSFVPVLQGDSDMHREAVITGYHEAADRCVRDATWSYVQRPQGEGDELYNLVEDPKERTNLIGRFPDEARRLASAFGGFYRLGSVQEDWTGLQGRYELTSSGIE
jgi:choline-sulfatase